jgi:hypothetical protein
LAAATAARERLEEARRRLQQNQRQSLQQGIDEARRRAEQLREQQRNSARESDASTAPGPEQMRQLNEQRKQLGDGVGELENRLDRLSAEARNGNREAGRQLQGAADAIRGSRVRERIRAAQENAQLRSREFNRAQEEQIGRDLDNVSQQIAAAGAAAGDQSAAGQARATGERARQLAQGVEGMRDRARSAQETPNGSATSRGQSRSGGSEGETQRQLRAEARERAGELQGIQRQLRQSGVDASTLNDELAALRALQSAAPYNDPEEVERLLTRVARGLQDLEFDLRTALQDEDLQKLHLSSEGQVPVQFRKAVEDYYRALARKRN